MTEIDNFSNELMIVEDVFITLEHRPPLRLARRATPSKLVARKKNASGSSLSCTAHHRKGPIFIAEGSPDYNGK